MWVAVEGLCVCVQFFFFSSRRRHTRLQGDWSSDVCSSDLDLEVQHERRPAGRTAVRPDDVGRQFVAGRDTPGIVGRVDVRVDVASGGPGEGAEIGRASCRGRVEISVVAGSFKKKKKY